MPRNGSGGFSRASPDYVAGTTVDEAAVNADLNDMGTALAGSIAADGQTPITANLVMSNFKHTGVGAATVQTDYMRADQVQKGTANLLTSVGGTADVITATAAFSMTTLVAGMRFIAEMASTSTSTTPTLNINAIGAKTIKKGAGDALDVGDIIAAAVGDFYYDGTDMILLNPATIPVSSIPGLPGTIITSGEVGAAFIADLAASIITTGTMDAARLPDATTSAEGIVELATTAEMTAGTANKIPDAAKVKAFVGTPVFSDSFTSTDQTITSAGALTIAHGLGTVPILVQNFLICQSADLNFGVGDVVPINDNLNTADNFSAGQSIVLDSTNINVRYGSSSNVYRLLDNTSGDKANIDPTKWKLRIKVFA